jgi:hypothetical protein
MDPYNNTHPNAIQHATPLLNMHNLLNPLKGFDGPEPAPCEVPECQQAQLRLEIFTEDGYGKEGKGPGRWQAIRF